MRIVCASRRQINRSPSQVRQDFAKKITCYTNNGNPKPVIDEFKYDPLPMIAVSVDMLDTGYDQKDIENLVMLRPTKSPIKYAQMRGRGSRLCPKIGKTEFIIYDFVGNSKRFNDPGEPYHKPKLVGVAPGSRPAETGRHRAKADVPQAETRYHLSRRRFARISAVIAEGSLDDEIRAREIILVGPEGLAMDRKTYREEWEKKVVELQTYRSRGGKDIPGRRADRRGMGRPRPSPQFARSTISTKTPCAGPSSSPPVRSPISSGSLWGWIDS